ncbi:MAG: sigma-70 family RNA polymerase sigma factor [Egibacteraceae bacterium]
MTATAGPSTVDATLLWQQLHDRLLGFITRRVARLEDAEDILQEVMLRVHRHAGDLEHAEHVVGWVYRIANNTIVDHYRRTARRELPTGQGVDLLLPDVGSASDMAGSGEAEPRRELAACLMPLLDSLSPRQREAIMLTEVEGLTQAAAAAQVGLSVSGMKARVQRARKQLKTLLVACCPVEQDRRGGIIGYRVRGSCEYCGPDC